MIHDSDIHTYKNPERAPWALRYELAALAFVPVTDARLSDARPPLAHTHALSEVTGLLPALAGKEALANKSTLGTLADNSDTLYPSQKAVKTYADTKLPLTGGTLSGALTVNGDVTIGGGNDLNFSAGDPTIYQADDASSMRFGVNPAGGGPQFQLFGATHGSFPGSSYFDAGSSGAMNFRFDGYAKALVLPASGDMNWTGFNVAGTPTDPVNPTLWIAVKVDGNAGFIPWHAA